MFSSYPSQITNDVTASGPLEHSFLLPVTLVCISLFDARSICFSARVRVFSAIGCAAVCASQVNGSCQEMNVEVRMNHQKLSIYYNTYGCSRSPIHQRTLWMEYYLDFMELDFMFLTNWHLV